MIVVAAAKVQKLLVHDQLHDLVVIESGSVLNLVLDKKN